MQKTYWWRIVLLTIGLVVSLISYILINQEVFGLCNEVYSTGSYTGCLDSTSITIGEPLSFVSISLLAVSIFLFFINDLVFKKWLRFAVIWFIFTFILIGIAPERSGGWGGPDYTFTKELTSVWMSSLFVIISLVKIAWDSYKLKKLSN